jgi:F5/8 type C domain
VTTEAAADVVYQPLEGVEDKTDGTSSVDPGVQSAKLALLGHADRRGAVAYRYRPEPGALFQIRWARWNGRRWVRQAVYAGERETEAAIATTVHHDRARVYYTVKPPVCDPGSTETGGLFVAERSVRGGSPQPTVSWRTRLLDDAAQILRLATLTRRDGTDVLYLAAPSIDDPPASRLYFATLPRTGRDAVTTGHTRRPWAAADETNWAYDADAVVSSMLTPQNTGKCAVDGNRVERNSRWISARGDTAPTITLTLRQPIDVERVEVYSGFFGDTTAIVRAFTVQLLVDGVWQNVAAVADNTSSPAVVPVDPPGPTDQVRLVLTDPSGYTGGSDLARVFEVEVYGTEATP